MSLLYYYQEQEASGTVPPIWLLYLSPTCSVLLKSCCYYLLIRLDEYITSRKIRKRKALVDNNISISASRENISKAHAAYLQRRQTDADRSVIEYHHAMLQKALRKPSEHTGHSNPENDD
ncbi:hypothetical protein [Chitinophaga deserti]|uniref:hypothetical protein n=1 Tax=Chitinophaga deserti TaxID=2164099 RepID=UPI0013006711|nr:hypothetical protein [Chitinophaga deserti]